MKRICIKNKKTGVIMRLVRTPEIEKLVESGDFAYTNKQALKHYINNVIKLHTNSEKLKNIDFSTKQENNFINTEGNSKYAYVYKGYRDRVEKIIPPKTIERKLNWWDRFKSVAFSILGKKYEPKLITVLEEAKQQIMRYPLYTRYKVA